MLTDVENEGLKLTPIKVAIFGRYIWEKKKKNVLRKLIRNAWRNAMRFGNNTVPPCLCSNQSPKWKKEDVLKFSLIKNIYQSPAEYQHRETEKSIINRRNKYRWNENATYLTFLFWNMRKLDIRKETEI